MFFWKIDEHANPYRSFSNWYPASFVDNAARPPVHYANVEQYMMAAKATTFRAADPRANDGLRDAIMRASDPATIKALGRQVRGFSPKAWDAPSKTAVFNACYLKFAQSPALYGLLLSTGDRVIAEAAPNDAVWGIGTTAHQAGPDPRRWRGENRLGKVLMRVREQLRREQAGAPPLRLRPVAPVRGPSR